MERSEVVKLLSGLSYRPGWTFKARPLQRWEAELSGWTGCDVVFLMACETVNTDRECAAKGYPETKVLDWELPLTAESFNDDGHLLRSVFDLIMNIELHESREFFRQKNENWEAPFHPHKEEGNLRWELTDSVSVSA